MRTVVRRHLNTVLQKDYNGVPIVIVGAGYMGEKLIRIINKWHLGEIVCLFDNYRTGKTGFLPEYDVIKPKYKDNAVYVISIQESSLRDKLYCQLLEIGILDEDIVVYDDTNSVEYRKKLEKNLYPVELEEYYHDIFGYYINHENPQTYNEIINWEKLHVKDERRSKLADKYLVKSWIKERIGEEYVVKLCGAWDNAYDIDFDILPDNFVLKVNNGSERNIIVKDKGKIDTDQVCRQLNDWMSYSFEYEAYEPHYSQIAPKIICEEYLEGIADDLYDYNIYCFKGEPRYIWCIKESHKESCKASFYDTEWNKQEFSYGYPLDEDLAPRPMQLEKMLELTRILCKDFEHVRVDWYVTRDGRIYFGEMTFTTWGGYMKFIPEKWDKIFGDMIKGKAGKE